MRSQDDRLLWGVAIALSLISLVALRSASATLNPSLVWRQAVWVAVGACAGWFVSRVAYFRWIHVAVPFYALSVLLLVVVEAAGTMKLGAERWLTIGGLSLQPSEVAKLATACMLARYLGSRPSPLSLRSLVVSGALASWPAVLILVQPDLGTATILWAVWFGTAWVAGMRRRHLAGLCLFAVALLPVGWHVLKDYQRARLLVFLNPHVDPLGTGYTIIQSTIAIGSGQWVGRGWMAGTQNQLNFLPERHADFLYSVIGEEWGFLGSCVVVGLIGCLIWRAVRIAVKNSEREGRMLAAALTSWIGYQAVINMGMVMGLAPVVGIPLPLVSYGGSAMVTTWMAIGLLQSIHRFGIR
ncbi:MAG: rod shape-determining protein RodA [Candidatus Omnitrophica bacterium]|nr:rod shape-determining protein RodA [Candidatus Omnitrophota bacterium]